jgi:hypothetical protein
MSLAPLEPGVWAILATPFRGDDLEVDGASIATLVEMYRNAGVKGLVALHPVDSLRRERSIRPGCHW